MKGLFAIHILGMPLTLALLLGIPLLAGIFYLVYLFYIWLGDDN